MHAHPPPPPPPLCFVRRRPTLLSVVCDPKDERYKHLIGGKVVVPLSGREIPIIADVYVDMEFGTGALKITPGMYMNNNFFHYYKILLRSG